MCLLALVSSFCSSVPQCCPLHAPTHASIPASPLPLQILICQNLRNNLQHPNEYIRGVTLRFLTRIHEEEILEPLVPSILANLDHRHSYVRRSAVLAISAVYRLPKGELMLAVRRAGRRQGRADREREPAAALAGRSLNGGCHGWAHAVQRPG